MKIHGSMGNGINEVFFHLIPQPPTINSIFQGAAISTISKAGASWHPTMPVLICLQKAQGVTAALPSAQSLISLSLPYTDTEFLKICRSGMAFEAYPALSDLDKISK